MTFSTRALVCASLCTALVPLAATAAFSSPEDEYPSGSAKELTMGQATSGKLSSTTPEQVYKIEANAKGVIRVVLGDLSADYDVALYDSSKKVASSTLSGSRADEITAFVSPGTYKIKVYPKNDGNYSVDSFYLKATLHDKVQILNTKLSGFEEKTFVASFINPTPTVIGISGKIQFLNNNGKVVASRDVDYSVMAKPGQMGYVTEFVGEMPSEATRWKFANAKLTSFNCDSGYRVPVSNFSTTPKEKGAFGREYRVRGQITNPGPGKTYYDVTAVHFDERRNADNALVDLTSSGLLNKGQTYKLDEQAPSGVDEKQYHWQGFATQERSYWSCNAN